MKLYRQPRIMRGNVGCVASVLLFVGCVFGPDEDIRFAWQGVSEVIPESVEVERTTGSMVIDGVWQLPSACVNLELKTSRNDLTLELRIELDTRNFDGCESLELTAIYRITILPPVSADSVVLFQETDEVLRTSI